MKNHEPRSPASTAEDREVIRSHGRPKARLFGIIALLWILPSFGAVFLIARGLKRLVAVERFSEFWTAVTFEQWIAVMILIAHAAFLGLARHYRKHEPIREECFEP